MVSKKMAVRQNARDSCVSWRTVLSCWAVSGITDTDKLERFAGDDVSGTSDECLVSNLHRNDTRIIMEEKPPAVAPIALDAYRKVFRTDFGQPGFALFTLGPEFGSEQQRQLMVELKQEFDRLEQTHRRRRLVYQSLGRFDQQVTTKPHRDGGPDESILMLGYEPTLVESRISMSDYSQCAHDMGLTPAEFLDRHNPMFADGEQRLANYTTAVAEFDNSSFQILIINNSQTPSGSDRLQGVLHTAEIINPNPNEMRVVNSTMISAAAQTSDEEVSPAYQQEFIRTDVIRRAAYE